MGLNVLFLCMSPASRAEYLSSPFRNTVPRWFEESWDFLIGDKLVIGQTDFAPRRILTHLVRLFPTFASFDVVEYFSKITSDYVAVSGMTFPVLSLFYAPVLMLL